MFSFVCENHRKHLTESIQGLFKHNLLVDCTLSAEHQFIYGHQVILGAYSPYFELLFSQKQDRKPVVLKNVKFQDLKSLVDFMYFGEVYIPTEQLNSFVETAKALQVKGLTNFYEQYNNVESSDDSVVHEESKCGEREWNFCEKKFRIKRESESHSSALDTFEREKCAEENYNADGCNEGSVRELNLTLNRDTVNEKSKVYSPNSKENSTRGQHMIQDVAECDSFSGALKINYEDNSSAVCVLPFIKEENESHFMQDGSNCANVSNRNVVDHRPVDIKIVIKGEIEIEENELNFNDNHEGTNLSEITFRDALPSTSQDSLNHGTAVNVPYGVDFGKDFGVNLENISSEFVSTSPKPDGCEESRGSGGDNVILGLENVDLNVWSSVSYGLGEECTRTYSGHKLYLPDNTNALENVETEKARLSEKSEDQTGLLKDTAIEAGDGTRLKENQSITLPKGSPSFTILKPHFSAISRNASYKCSHSSKRFSDNNKMKTHTHVHKNELQYECKLCLKRFFDSSRLERHLRVHAKPRKFQCTICSKRFIRSQHMKNHLMTHSGEKRYQCTICSKRFTESGTLKIHLLTHSGVKNFQCTVCSKRFIQSQHLKRHLLTHTGEKNYQCSVCSKRFTQSQHLKTHLVTHSGEKKYQCTVCFKRFTWSHHLKRHLLTHSGEKNYQCTVCSRKFTESGTMKKHLLTHSRDKNYQCTV